MEFGMIIDKLDDKTFITVNYLTQDEEKSNREVIEFSYVETCETSKDEIINIALREMRKCLESKI